MTILPPVHFRPGKSANILRGAFGSIFQRIACVPDCPGVRECEIRAACPYARMFEPSALAGGPSGLADWPRPFVFRATHLDGHSVTPGGTFSFDLNLFDMRSPAIAYLVLAFAQLAHEGLGPSRGRADDAEPGARGGTSGARPGAIRDADGIEERATVGGAARIRRAGGADSGSAEHAAGVVRRRPFGDRLPRLWRAGGAGEDDAVRDRAGGGDAAQ